MGKKDLLIGCVFFFVGIVSRFPFLERMQSHWDGPQYSIGVVRYMLSQETPAPPGYPLFIGIGRLMYEFSHDPHRAILLVSVLFSGLGAAIIYLAGRRLFNRPVGVIASLLFLSGPTFYFFGLTAYPYGVIPTIATALALSSYLSLQRKRIGVILGVVFSLALGFRPQEFIMFTPLFLVGLYNLPRREKVFAIFSFTVTSLVWILPFLYVVGGVTSYINSFVAFSKNGAIPLPSPENSLSYLGRMGKGFFLTFTLSGVFMLYFSMKLFLLKKGKGWLRKSILHKKVQLFFVWIVPSFLVNFLIRSDHAGYQMTYLSGCIILIAYSLWVFFQKRRYLLASFVALIIAFNIWWFVRDRDPGMKNPYIPTSFHYSEIRKNDTRLSAKVAYIREHFDPKSTLIVTSGQPWRPLMYYLRQYAVENPDGLFTKDARFSNLIRIGNDWNFTQRTTDKLFLMIPSGVKTIVFTDEDVSNYLSSLKRNEINLPGNGLLTILPVVPGEVYEYSYHSLQKAEQL
ncbi:MAG: glycosyltransferase family 39 protein [bacterium]|nr:glycosyltransferase family 39 protein [bacterium]